MFGSEVRGKVCAVIRTPWPVIRLTEDKHVTTSSRIHSDFVFSKFCDFVQKLSKSTDKSVEASIGTYLLISARQPNSRTKITEQGKRKKGVTDNCSTCATAKVRWEPDAHAICTLSSKCTRLKRIIATTDEIHLEAAQLVDISGNFVHHSLNFGIGKGHHFKVSDGSD